MTFALRDYQQRGVTEIRQAFRDGHKAVLYQLPTGGGKTVLSGYILGGTAQKGKHGLFICNRVELLKQTTKTLGRLGVEYGVIAAGFTPNPGAQVQVASIDTLRARLHKMDMGRFRLAVWDECRSIASASWSKVMASMPNAAHLGLDATPERGDGTGLGQFFSHMVCGPKYSELLAVGSLVPFRVLAPGGQQLDMSGVHSARGDFVQSEVEELIDKPTLVGDVVDHYLRHARGLRGITFGASVRHSQHLAAMFNANGVPAVHLDADSDKVEKGARDRAVAAFRRGELLQLCNVNLFSAGFDVPGVQVISDVAPTQSLSMFLQRAGRGSRPDEDNPDKRSCLLLDHAGNVFRHGLPDEDRDWSLAGRTKKKGKKRDEQEEHVMCCSECFAIVPTAPACRECGHVRAVQGRKVEVTPEALAALKAAKAKKISQARTMEELQAIARESGYSPGWARHVFESRKASHDRYSKGGQARAEAQFAAYARR
jgi:DNA repair protein RadD